MAVIPQSDTPLQKLVLYLKEGMNAESQLYTGKNAVEGTREFQADLNAVDRFPLLMAYRTAYRGSEFQVSDITIEWFLASPVELEDLPGYLNWGMRTLGRLLNEIDSTMPTPCMQIDTENKDGQIRFGQIRDGGQYFSFVRIVLTDVVDLE